MLIPTELHPAIVTELYDATFTGRGHPATRALYVLRERICDHPRPLERLAEVYRQSPELYDLLWTVWCLDPLGRGEVRWARARLSILEGTLAWEATANLVADWLSEDRQLPWHTLDAVWAWHGELTIDLHPVPQPSTTYQIRIPDDVEEVDGVVPERLWCLHLPSLWSSAAGHTRPPGQRSLREWLRTLRRSPTLWARLEAGPEGPLWTEAAPLLEEH